MGFLDLEIKPICTKDNAIRNVLNKHSHKIQLKHANHVKLNVKIVSVHQPTVLNVSFRENIKLFCLITVVFTLVLTDILKISTPINAYVQ